MSSIADVVNGKLNISESSQETEIGRASCRERV